MGQDSKHPLLRLPTSIVSKYLSLNTESHTETGAIADYPSLITVDATGGNIVLTTPENKTIGQSIAIVQEATANTLSISSSDLVNGLATCLLLGSIVTKTFTVLIWTGTTWLASGQNIS